MENQAYKFRLAVSRDANPSLRVIREIAAKKYMTATAAYKDLPSVANDYKLDHGHLEVKPINC